MTSVSRKYFAEFVGTFGLTFAGTGAIIIERRTPGAVGGLGIAIAFGLAVMVMVYALGDISGAHINPAVTAGFVLGGRFSGKTLPMYWASQVFGAILASLLLRAMFGNVARLGATVPTGGVAVAFSIEIVLGFLLMIVVMAATSGPKVIWGMAAGAIGGMIMLGAIVAGPVSGASMNPARSLGPALVSGNLQSLWLYLLAPVIGTALGAIFYRLLLGGE